MSASQPKPIKLLDPQVIHRIAAGEVVDRPSSVLKELLDNSIDAGSTKIKIVLVEGGLERMEIEDDGWGLSLEDLKVCAQRHATSKIQNIDDLDAIFSLGFRGEALSAISSVSKFRIETVRQGVAWNLEIQGGGPQDIRPGTRSYGTKVIVEDLFFNVPARRKFLKSAQSEWTESQEILQSVALAHPQLSFEWHLLDSRGELKKSQVLPAQSLPERFAKITGLKGEIIQIDQDPSHPGLKKISAVFYKPPVSSRFQKSLRLSVNGRPIQDKRLPFVVREAFSGLIEVGQYPVGHIDIQVDVSLIDVNIHPQKKEIRWPNDLSIHSLIYSVLRPHFESRSYDLNNVVSPDFPPISSLETTDSLAQSSSLNSSHSLSSWGSSQEALFAAPAPSVGISDSLNTAGPSISVQAPFQTKARINTSLEPIKFSSTPEPAPFFKFSELRVVGEIGAAWLVAESPSGMILVDQHAAHERINYERILNQKDLIRSKALLIPIPFKLSYEYEDLKVALRGLLESLGFEFSDEGDEIIAVPESDRKLDWDRLLKQVTEDLRSEKDLSGLKGEIERRIAASLACHGSIRRGQRLEKAQIEELFKQMDSVRWGGLCPHGRPVWFLLDHQRIESLFHR